LLVVGCEYAGTTVLAEGYIRWAERTRGAFEGVPEEYRIHDHFKFPDVTHPPDFTPEEHEQLMALSPRIKEMIQRHNVFYHLPHQGWKNDVVMIGLYFDDNIYGPLYFDYIHNLAPDDPIMQTRSMFEQWLLKGAPNIQLVHVTASAEVIAQRMRDDPRPNGLLQEKDIDHVLQRFSEECVASTIPNKLTIDTSSLSVEQSVAELVKHLS